MKQHITSDLPKADPKDDHLGYAPFAQRLASSLHSLDVAHGLVTGIYGPWGSGKSTLLNFVEYYLNQLPDDEQLFVIRFNPWWFSGHEDLARVFFEQLLVNLDEEQYGEKELRRRIADFANAVSGSGFPQAWIPKTLAYLIGPGNENIPELKREIEALLEKQRRILVIIDDIDRLTNEEIRQLFRVVKAVGDFPNVMYLLSFDKNVVANALQDIQGSSTDTDGRMGHLYLEKIIQLTFELPVPERDTLLAMFAESLNAILDDTPAVPFDENHWRDLLFEGIAHFIETPRGVHRLINTLSVTYNAVQGDVDIADFIAIETLRVFCPQVYDIIRQNSEAFAGHAGANVLFGQTAQDFKPFHETWLSGVRRNDRDAVQHLVSTLFPKLKAVWGNTHYGPDHAADWRKDLRICSKDIFPAYFRLSLPAGTISRTEVERIIALASDPETFGQKLLELTGERRDDGTSRAGGILDRLGDYARSDIPEESIPNIVRAFLTVGEMLLLPEDEDNTFFNRGNDMQMAYLMEILVKRLDKPERYLMLRSAIEEGEALSLIVDYVGDIGKEHGRLDRTPLPDNLLTVDESELIELEKLAAKKLKEAAQHHALNRQSLLQRPKLEHNLYRWRDWGGRGDIDWWFAKLSNEISDEQLTDEQTDALQRFVETNNRHGDT